jgi:hypothetical protein
MCHTRTTSQRSPNPKSQRSSTQPPIRLTTPHHPTLTCPELAAYSSHKNPRSPGDRAEIYQVIDGAVDKHGEPQFARM